MSLNIEIEVQDCENLTLEIVDAQFYPGVLIEDAESDGKTYARKDGAWIEVDGAGADLSGYATEEWVEDKEYVSNAQIDTDADLAANSDALIPSQKAVKAYVDNNAGGDVTADGNNVFTGSNTFEQPVKAPILYDGEYTKDIAFVDLSSSSRTASLNATEEGALYYCSVSVHVDDDGERIATIDADTVIGLESRVGTFPLAFDMERTYGSKETPLTGNLGWTKSSDDKRVYQEVYHNDSTAPTELASMTKVGDGVYMPSETNLIYIWCSLPNATNIEDGYFYTVTQV